MTKFVPLDNIIEVGENQPQPTYVPAYARGLVTLNGEELLKREFPPREMLLAPWLPTQGLAMIYAGRGIEKTWTALNVAYAVASGGEFLGWKAPKARRVVYIDGDMPAVLLKERFAAVVKDAPKEANPDFFRLVAADLQPDGLPDLADPEAQRFYAGVIEDADLVVIDNLSTIARGVRENEADSWGPVQAWALGLRAIGKSVFFIHHAGKSGGQRGTSKKEDLLDTVISLRRPPNYDSSQGARFEVHFTKARGFLGDEANPFEAQLVDGVWRTREIVQDEDLETLQAFQAQGLSYRQIEERTGLSKSAVGRLLKGAEWAFVTLRSPLAAPVPAGRP